MNPLQIILILRARYKLALLLMFCTVAIAIPVIQSLPRLYTATTSLVVDVRPQDPVSAMLLPSNRATQEDIIRSHRVAVEVVNILQLEEDATLQEQWHAATGGAGSMQVWLVGLLQRHLAVTSASRESSVLRLYYQAEDPAFAAAVVNAFAQAYIDIMVELKVEPAKQYARWFGEHTKLLRENLENAQTRLSEFQQQKGIVVKDEKLDTEMATFNALSSQLTAVQADAATMRSKERSNSASALPEVLQSNVVQGLRSEVARLEAKLKDGNLGRNHPQYKRMQTELAELKANLAAETRHVTSTFSSSGSVSRDRERELRAAIDAQKKKLLELRNQRDQLAVLERDVDAAQSAYDGVAKRHSQASLESQTTQTNVFQLAPAVEPLEPSSPKVARYTLMAILAGVMLGLGAALGLELLDRRVRGLIDLVELLQLPVLGVINRHKRRRGLRFFRREAPLALRVR
jgi:succinoglycan biosynthesis transport protein ExoP